MTYELLRDLKILTYALERTQTYRLENYRLFADTERWKFFGASATIAAVLK